MKKTVDIMDYCNKLFAADLFAGGAPGYIRRVQQKDRLQAVQRGMMDVLTIIYPDKVCL